MRRLERTKLDTREFLLYSILQMLTIVGQTNGKRCPFQELRSSMHNRCKDSASLFPTRKVWRTGRCSTTHFRSVTTTHGQEACTEHICFASCLPGRRVLLRWPSSMHRQRGRSGSTSRCRTACRIGSSRKKESSKLTTCNLWKEEEDVEQREGSDTWSRES